MFTNSRIHPSENPAFMGWEDFTGWLKKIFGIHFRITFWNYTLCIARLVSSRLTSMLWNAAIVVRLRWMKNLSLPSTYFIFCTAYFWLCISINVSCFLKGLGIQLHSCVLSYCCNVTWASLLKLGVGQSIKGQNMPMHMDIWTLASSGTFRW